MHSMGKTIAELHAMLKLHEKSISKKVETPDVLAIREGKIQKKKPQGAKGKDKGKTKLAYAPKAKIPPPPKTDNLAKDFICHHCKEVGHWRRNCPSYHAELKKRKNRLRESRKLKHGALSLYVGNGMRAAVEAIGSFDLIQPSGLIIVLDNCHFAPTITRGVVSISRFVDNDMHNLYPKVSSIYSVSNTRAKHTLDSTYIWHCHLGHINKKRMEKLQCDGILQPNYDESLKKCKSCISGKMAQLCEEKVLITSLPLPMILAVMVMIPKRNDRLLLYYPLENKIFVAQNAELFENSLTLQEASESHGLLKASGSDVEPYRLEVPIRRSGRISQAPNRYGFYVDVEEHELGDLNEPLKYKVALLNPKFDKLLDAMNTKIQSLKDNQVWCLVDLPPNGRTVRNIRAIKILLAIVAFFDYEIWQMDVKTAFLNGHLSEDNKRFDVKIKKIGFTQNPNEPCVYLKASGSNVAFLVLYVDDILVTDIH
ncbi:retrotransposon protein, putative, ty1-copia subclass [Tanacetum coccineum]